MQETSKKTVTDILNHSKPKRILDAPCGKGWIASRLDYDFEIHGIDLYDTPRDGYSKVLKYDLDYGIPDSTEKYDCICCCEGIEHFGNPLLFFEHAKKLLKPNGLFVVTTPNTWYPDSKLQFFLRGFFPSFPCIVGRIERGSHMHITPWSFPHLYLYLKLSSFADIDLHDEPLSRHKHLYELFLGLPQKLYCLSKGKKSKSDEERRFWKIASSKGSVYGRHLIVTAHA